MILGMRFSFGEIDKGPCEIKPAALGCSCTKKIYGKLYQGATFHYKICCFFHRNAHTLQCIANYCSLPLFSFGHALGKLQGKVLTHSKKVGWWKTLMVECVSIF